MACVYLPALAYGEPWLTGRLKNTAEAQGSFTRVALCCCAALIKSQIPVLLIIIRSKFIKCHVCLQKAAEAQVYCLKNRNVQCGNSDY